MARNQGFTRTRLVPDPRGGPPRAVLARGGPSVRFGPEPGAAPMARPFCYNPWECDATWPTRGGTVQNPDRARSRRNDRCRRRWRRSRTSSPTASTRSRSPVPSSPRSAPRPASPTSGRSSSPTSRRRSCIELKSLKLYLFEYRNRGIFYEHSVNTILDDLVAACQPRRMRVIGQFTPRGGISSRITACFDARAVPTGTDEAIRIV